MDVDEKIKNIDNRYIVDIRRRLHMRPEIGFELPDTVALVKAELEKIGVPYTEKYGKGSVVAYINKGTGKRCIGIRADMDALPIEETNDLSYRSQKKGMMHACGHDAHTAMLLGTARALKAMKDQLDCSVTLLFQPCEEGELSGAKMMVENGVTDDFDLIIGLHVENWLDAGTVGVCPGPSMAASRPVKLEFFGRTAHATLPQTGSDALAMAVKTYNGIQTMLTREIDPFARRVCSVGALNAGTTDNVIPDYARMLISLRTFDTALEDFIVKRIGMIAAHAAEELGGSSKLTSETKAFPVINDPALSELLLQSARKVVGQEGIAPMPMKMSSEDFSFYLTRKPGVFFRLGTRNAEKGITSLPHNSNFMIDEDALATGSRVCVQFVVDNMHGLRRADK